MVTTHTQEQKRLRTKQSPTALDYESKYMINQKFKKNYKKILETIRNTIDSHQIYDFGMEQLLDPHPTLQVL